MCISANFFSLMYDDHNHTANNTGAVHSAKIDIANHHCQKLPVLIAINCIDKVNQHGKKNVNAPISGANTGFFVVSVWFDQLLGKCIPKELILGRICNKCNHIQRTTRPTIIVKIVVVVSDIAIALPINHNNHPKIKKPPILHAWKESCTLI